MKIGLLIKCEFSLNWKEELFKIRLVKTGSFERPYVVG